MIPEQRFWMLYTTEKPHNVVEALVLNLLSQVGAFPSILSLLPAAGTQTHRQSIRLPIKVCWLKTHRRGHDHRRVYVDFIINL